MRATGYLKKEGRHKLALLQSTATKVENKKFTSKQSSLIETSWDVVRVFGNRHYSDLQVLTAMKFMIL